MKLIGLRSVRLLLLVMAMCGTMAAAQSWDTSVDLAKSTNRFGFALLPQLEAQRRNDNIFYSPISMMLALSMAYNGAGGRTERAMHRVLDFETLSLEEVNQASANLLAEIARDEAGLKLTIANSLWARKDVTFRPEFLSRNQKFHRADASILDFADPASVAAINDWVSRRTGGKIPAVIDALEPDDLLVLISAVYFKGAWTYPFAPSQTRDEVFYLPSGTRTQVPTMMATSERLRCYSGAEGDAVVLPYGASRAQMELFLPPAGVPIGKFVREFNYETYLHWRQQLIGSGSATLKLPRVKLRYTTDLKPSLQKFGMGVAFTSAADFRGIAPSQKLRISQASHIATLELDEKGTEAAAVTAIGGVGVSGRRAPVEPPPPCAFIANRPFVVVITHGGHDVILFMGVVTNPQPGTE
jgi:serine protease inhibitor